MTRYNKQLMIFIGAACLSLTLPAISYPTWSTIITVKNAYTKGNSDLTCFMIYAETTAYHVYFYQRSASLLKNSAGPKRTLLSLDGYNDTNDHEQKYAYSVYCMGTPLNNPNSQPHCTYVSPLPLLKGSNAVFTFGTPNGKAQWLRNNDPKCIQYYKNYGKYAL